MKKYSFLVLCGSHCGQLCGKLAILHTDILIIGTEEQSDASKFKPGTSIFWSQENCSCSAIILSNLGDSGYNQDIAEKIAEFKERGGMNPNWFRPEQFLTVEGVYIP